MNEWMKWMEWNGMELNGMEWKEGMKWMNEGRKEWMDEMKWNEMNEWMNEWMKWINE